MVCLHWSPITLQTTNFLHGKTNKSRCHCEFYLNTQISAKCRKYALHWAHMVMPIQEDSLEYSLLLRMCISMFGLMHLYFFILLLTMGSGFNGNVQPPPPPLHHGPLARYVKLRAVHARECRERFRRHHGLAIPTCITARA